MAYKEMERSRCCEMMEYHSTYNCNLHADKYECPDTLIDYNEKSEYFSIIIHDGGTSGIEINYCPWCGTELKNQLQINHKVTLVTFLGTLEPEGPVDPNENYWKLIGQRGQVIELGEERVLVKFECNIDSFGLENHNPVEDSLSILRTDLEPE